MASAAAKYAQEDTTEPQRPVKVSAEAGRKCVRGIHQCPVLSADWLALVDSLRQLTRLIQIEGSMPANTKVAEAHGRNTDSEGTLWDQEQHENAVRILVEEAKVNLCLRMMNDFKKWSYDALESEASFQLARQTTQYSESQLRQRIAQFEESLGLLLWRAFVHVETLQLMDIPLLLEHCALVLEHCCQESSEKSFGLKTQETVVLYYCSSLMKHAEALNNSELLAKARELRLVHLLARHVTAHGDYPVDLLYSVAEGLSALADNEDFRTNWEDFFVGADGESDREAKTLFLELEEKVAKRVLEEKPECKKDIRPLLDFFAVMKRSLK